MKHGRQAPVRRSRHNWGRLDDLVSGAARVFPRFQSHLTTCRIDEVADVLQCVEDATRTGHWAFGFISYDAAAGLDPALPAASTDTDDNAGSALPLVWFGLAPPPLQSPDLVPRRSAYHAGPWTHQWTQVAYDKAFSRVKETIAAGRTYQCNL